MAHRQRRTHRPRSHAGFLSQLACHMVSPPGAADIDPLKLPAGVPTLLDANGKRTQAAAFMRETEIEVAVRVALEVFIDRWIEFNVPMDVAMPPDKKRRAARATRRSQFPR